VELKKLNKGKQQKQKDDPILHPKYDIKKSILYICMYTKNVICTWSGEVTELDEQQVSVGFIVSVFLHYCLMSAKNLSPHVVVYMKCSLKR
jgi:hypothetical protein